MASRWCTLGAPNHPWLRVQRVRFSGGVPARRYSLEGGQSAEGFSRHNFNAVISEQDMQESYIPGFKLCVTQGKPAQIMCSYNAINGIPSCLHGDLLNGLVRERWGYEGLIVSDQDSINDAWAGTNKTGHTGHFYGKSYENVTAMGKHTINSLLQPCMLYTLTNCFCDFRCQSWL
jgi:hypothetical protein